MADAEDDQEDSSWSSEPISIEGRFNVRELLYLDGTVAYDYLLMTDGSEQYLLEFDDDFVSDLLQLAGKDVLVEGFPEDDDRDMDLSSQTQREQEKIEKRIKVSSLNPSDGGSDEPEIRGLVSDSTALSHAQSRKPPETIQQIIAPLKFADRSDEPHSKGYYAGEFYTDENYSLAAYWRDASYGKLTVDGPVLNWMDLPRAERYYLDFGERDSDSIKAIDSRVDFDGPDDTIQNNSPDIGGPGDNGDDIDSIIAIYNGDLGAGIAGYAYYEPIAVQTTEGMLYVYYSAIRDQGFGSPVGAPSDYFVGVAAHEMGHNFGWHHTTTPSCVYCDPWSVMSGGIYSPLGPSGPISSERDSAGWIDPDDIFVVNIDRDDSVEFTLDILGNPSSSNFLMAKIPFGNEGQYFTLEARKNVKNDHTPFEQMGLVIYDYSPTGHPNNMEPDAPETIVDTTITGDLAFTDLSVGDSFDLANGLISVGNVAQSDNSITVIVTINQVNEEPLSDCSGKATIIGTPGPDIIEGTSDDDIIDGLGGNDLIYGKGGNDKICGGDGDDILYGNAGQDSIWGDGGDDEIIGGRGDDHLFGGAGKDKLLGWSGKDTLQGGTGDDLLYGGDGTDEITGGTGYDHIWTGEGKDIVIRS